MRGRGGRAEQVMTNRMMLMDVIHGYKSYAYQENQELPLQPGALLGEAGDLILCLAVSLALVIKAQLKLIRGGLQGLDHGVRRDLWPS
jgi:hypothetical protein